jgi:hypothetical protein
MIFSMMANLSITDVIESSQCREVIKHALSANDNGVQKPDDPGTILAHIIRGVQRLPREDWARTLEATASAHANSHQNIRRIVESPEKVDFLVSLFAYPYFEESVSILNPSFFNKLYLVSSSVRHLAILSQH